MRQKKSVFLDSNAGAPISPQVRSALSHFLESTSNADSFPSNPSSIHAHGRVAKKGLAEAREAIAKSFGPSIDTEQLIFTGSGTEANQLAIQSILRNALTRSKSPHWLLSPVEHDSVLQLLEWAKSHGINAEFIAIDEQGRPLFQDFLTKLTPDTACVSLVWVNNETGVISEIEPFIRECNHRKVKIHIDAAQAWGKLSFDLEKLAPSSASFTSHKIGALSGLGILWVNRGFGLEPTIYGKQEKGRRGGTENLIGIIACGAAARELDPITWQNEVEPLRDRLENLILETVTGARINGKGAPRVANTLNLSFQDVGGDGLVMALDLAGYSVSSGSACSSGVLEPSHVLLAMGRSKEEAMAAVRVSLPHAIAWENLENFAKTLAQLIEKFRRK